VRSAPLDSDLDYMDWLNEYNEPAGGHTDPGVLEMEMRVARQRQQPERTEQQHIVTLLRGLGAADEP